jgi:hypothetical protein
VSIISLLLVAALYVGPLLKRSPSETGLVVRDQGQALERHIIPNLKDPEDKDSWYTLNERGEVTSVSLKGKWVTKGMVLEQVTDLLGKPCDLPENEPTRDHGRIATYWIQGCFFHFYFDSAESPTVNFIMISGGY